MSSHDPSERAPIFVVMPFDSEFDDIHATIKRALATLGLEAIRADDIKVSAPVVENIYNAIEQAGLVIGVTSKANPNVTYELGYAHHVNKETILLTDDASSVPFDLRHLHHLTYSSDDMAGLAKGLQAWIQNSRFLASERSRGTVLRRGEVFDAVVDGTFYLQRSRPLPSKAEIAGSLAQHATLPQRLLYLTEEGQSTYLTLCEDPEYVYYHETVKYVVDNAAALIAEVLEHCDSREVDFISLGPGNGAKDAVLIRALLQHARSPKYTYYYPYDVSGGLLLEAIRTILAKGLPLERLRIKAIEADIAYLAEFKKVFDFREEPNVYSLLGGLDNLGNEVALLHRLHELMNPQDCLLLEMRKKAGSGPQALGRIDLNRRLDLAPLRYIGAEVDRESVDYTEIASTSSIPNARTIAATVPSWKLDGKTQHRTSLFSVHYYDDQELRKIFKRVGFQIVYDDDNGQSNSLFYAVRKT
ncbi:MAG: L-histidine N(alpha)-methyltransferase [Solirubrobacterales bacterium]